MNIQEAQAVLTRAIKSDPIGTTNNLMIFNPEAVLAGLNDGLRSDKDCATIALRALRGKDRAESAKNLIDFSSRIA